jgi:hypothetical protein
LKGQIAEVSISKGFEIRSLGKCRRTTFKKLGLRRAFHPDEPDEDYEGWEWYLISRSNPCTGEI